MLTSTARRRSLAKVLVAALALALIATSCDLAYPPGEGNLRYRDPVVADVTKTADITYGQAVDQQGATKVLKLDLYEPAGDTVTARPLIIWVHGGGFSSGSKTSGEIVEQATSFARRGYVTASISYRLSPQGCREPNATCIESIYDAIEDAQAAVRFFRRYASRYRIDPNRIAMAGTSAGAITALNVGYATPVPGNSGNPGYSSAIRAAASLSGAVIFTGSVGPGDAPALLFHGTNDGLVPYSWATATRDTAEDAGLRAALVTWEGEGHVPYYEHSDQISDLTRNFFYAHLDAARAAR
ncbi:alpha/beta hydrolase [Iamia sp. SCSIO 61187]|uniref:alpha/beta hydrolase n=1 Tax=Iamia sp. SCSIO 61187 TaxID=2722752 RepID=UPI001C624901|nr:alpha/beta hydrolase [Iamia sp. SCSIO 61187]QYG94927.1 alpha/beta hydrolase [Iamia sp. SCSIO 61187]